MEILSEILHHHCDRCQKQGETRGKNDLWRSAGEGNSLQTRHSGSYPDDKDVERYIVSLIDGTYQDGQKDTDTIEVPAGNSRINPLHTPGRLTLCGQVPEPLASISEKSEPLLPGNAASASWQF